MKILVETFKDLIPANHMIKLVLIRLFVVLSSPVYFYLFNVQIKGIGGPGSKNMSSLFCRTQCCGPIHGMYLFENFDAFNNNIEYFIGKNNKKFTKNYPSIFYAKVKTPKN